MSERIAIRRTEPVAYTRTPYISHGGWTGDERAASGGVMYTEFAADGHRRIVLRNGRHVAYGPWISMTDAQILYSLVPAHWHQIRAGVLAAQFASKDEADAAEQTLRDSGQVRSVTVSPDGDSYIVRAYM